MAAPARKRPWYLVSALMGALALGTLATSAGWARVVLYRQTFDPSEFGEGIADTAEREAVEARAQAWLQALDDAKPRGWPLGVATLILGGAVFLYAMRTLGGGAARTALVQLVLAQGALNVVDYALMRNFWDAQGKFYMARQAALHHPLAHDAAPIGVALQSLGSALVVLGLTRPRSRRFLDATPEPVEDR
jgi:hypothetical protein